MASKIPVLVTRMTCRFNHNCMDRDMMRGEQSLLFAIPRLSWILNPSCMLNASYLDVISHHQWLCATCWTIKSLSSLIFLLLTSTNDSYDEEDVIVLEHGWTICVLLLHVKRSDIGSLVGTMNYSTTATGEFVVVIRPYAASCSASNSDVSPDEKHVPLLTISSCMSE